MRRRFLSRAATLAALGACLASSGLAGCGYTEQEWQVQTDKYQRVVAKQRASDEKLDQLTVDLEAQHARVAELEDRLKGMGVDLDAKDSALTSMTTTLADREAALAQYKLRTKQLEDVKRRFEALRARLDELVDLGIEVRIRRNRMIISLPGDVLFDSGKDKLRKEGKDILRKVGAVIHDDPLLEARTYQVAGHTDSKPLKGGNFGDNWGLSVMRARQVLLFLTDPTEGKLSQMQWSAAGYADTDPVATNETEEGRQQNRRCELVVMPSVEEMLDLRALAAEEGPPRPKGEPAPKAAVEPSEAKKPAEKVPAEKKPAEKKPAEPAKKPADKKPADKKPAEPAKKPADKKPAEPTKKPSNTPAKKPTK